MFVEFCLVDSFRFIEFYFLLSLKDVLGEYF